MIHIDKYIQRSPEVAEAKESGKPIVALESTIISHGMPYPQNLETARALENDVRQEGAVPATIAIMDGRIRIGLDEEALEYLAKAKNVSKVSRRDLPIILSQGTTGATTVAATMIGAHLAGIKIFATGGIGGVHRDGENTLDVSADLTELAQTPVAVVCAGAKSILDIGRTLEYLETQGVPVIGYNHDRFPAFYTRDSGYGVDADMHSPKAVAAMLNTKWDLGLKGGAIIANPVPEADAMDPDIIDNIIEKALKEASEQGISGKAVTPFLLNRVKELSEGHSLVTNIALVRNNARVAARIACEL